MEVYIQEPDEQELFDREPPYELTRAVDVAYRVCAAVEGEVEGETELPEALPKELVVEYAKLGASLADDECIEVQVPERQLPVKVTRASRERLATRTEAPYHDVVEVTGEVFEANVHKQRFQMLLPDGSTVGVHFNEAQETEVTTALRDHRVLRLTVKGKGEFSQDGQLKRIQEVDNLKPAPSGETGFDHSARSIEEELADIAAQVPAEAWDELPDDLTDHLDHYLYGTPKE